MKRLCLTLLAMTGLLAAQEKTRRLEPLVMLPEPRAMRTTRSLAPEGAQRTVLTAARETAGVPGVETYGEDDFKKLGLSVESFLEHAARAADKRLATLKPELVKDAEGKVLYAVYRGDSPLMASLFIAPSLPDLFETLFGDEIWVALPDRHALYIFPPKPEAMADFIPDLAERYRTDPHAASSEVFAIKKGGRPRVVGAFAR